MLLLDNFSVTCDMLAIICSPVVLKVGN